MSYTTDNLEKMAQDAIIGIAYYLHGWCISVTSEGTYLMVSYRPVGSPNIGWKLGTLKLPLSVD